MLYLNTIEQLFLFVEQLDQLEVCIPYSRLLAAIPIQGLKPKKLQEKCCPFPPVKSRPVRRIEY